MGTVTSSPAAGPANEITVNFTASNAQVVTINLLGVSAGNGTSTISVPLALLLGDVTQNRATNASDASQAKALSGNAIERDSYLNDVTINGVINSSDISTIKSQSGTNLPPSQPAKDERPAANAKR